MIGLLDKFKPTDGSPDKNASQTWAEIAKMLKQKPWSELAKSTLKEEIENINKNWTAWNGGN